MALAISARDEQPKEMTMMHRRQCLAGVVGILLLSATMVAAAHPHFISGPTFTASNGALSATAKIAGLGNQDVTVVLEATGVTTCRNRGGNVPPGQTETVSGQVSNLRPENGQVTFTVMTASVSNPCPDHMVPNTVFTSATLTVIQGGQI